MKLTLRHRILFTQVPILLLLIVLGGAAFVLLSRLGGRIDQILRENYDSVLYMERLNEALERIDSAFQFALVGREKQARQQHEENWKVFLANLEKEQNNVTLPGEGALVETLTAAATAYRRAGDEFFALAGEPARTRAYFGDGGQAGLYQSFQEIKSFVHQILRLNQQNMEDASKEARATATSSLLWFGIGLTGAALAAMLWTRQTVHTILQPIQAVTESALAIGAGNLHQVVPVMSGDELGQLAGAFNTMARQLRDYRESQQARLHRLQQTTQATINSFPHPVLVVDPEGLVELANPAVHRLLGVVPKAATQQLAVPWQPPEALRQPLWEALHNQHAYLPEGFDKTLPLRSGDQEKFFLPRILPIRSPEGLTLGAAVLLEDVTRYRLLDEVKSNLVATVSHELKTPLASIRLVVHLLLEETVGPLTPKQLDLLLDARDNTERLLGMINNLLDLARLQEGRRQLEVRPVAPAELLHAAAALVQYRADENGITLTVSASPDLPTLAIDAERVGHALHNLLDNALSYTPRGGRITLGAVAEGKAILLSVADTGAGIPHEYLPHVFEKFFRVPGRSQLGGTGLGLAIVQEIVTAHGGTVRCASRVGEGTVFYLALPVCAAAAAPVAELSPEGTEPAPLA